MLVLLCVAGVVDVVCWSLWLLMIALVSSYDGVVGVGFAVGSVGSCCL